MALEDAGLTFKDIDAVAQPERLGEDQLLVGVGRVQLGLVHLLGAHATSGPCLQQNLVCVLDGL